MDPHRWMKTLVALVILVHVSHQVPLMLVIDLYMGDNVRLPCESQPFEMHEPTVMWSRDDLSPSIVHQRQQDGDQIKDQNQLYRGRTWMRTDALTKGDLGLNLTALILSDSGNYTCSVRSSEGKTIAANIELRVKERFPSWVIVLLVVLPAVFLLVGGFSFRFRQYFMAVYQVQVDPGMTSVLLPCKTIVCLPSDVTVVWKCNIKNVHVYQHGVDHSGKQYCLYSGRTAMEANPLRDFSLTLNFPVDEDSETYTCSVYNTENNILVEKQVELKVKKHEVEVESQQLSVQLPFQTTENLPHDAVVQWTRYEPEHMNVHRYHNDPNNPDQAEEQNQWYNGRTKMMDQPLRTGDLNLTLKYPTDQDTGRYVCGVWGKKGQQKVLLRNKTVLLKVKVHEVEVEAGEPSVQLPFQTTENLPHDAVVQWTRYEPELMNIHRYPNNPDQAEEQNQRYKNLTEMTDQPLQTGNLSLTLKYPTDQDIGRHVCSVWRMEGQQKVLLRNKTVRLKVRSQYCSQFNMQTSSR